MIIFETRCLLCCGLGYDPNSERECIACDSTGVIVETEAERDAREAEEVSPTLNELQLEMFCL